MPPQTNATVTAVTGQGRPDDWDAAAVAGEAKWEGEARAYYRESLVELRNPTAGTVTVTTRRELILDYEDVAIMELDTDDVLTFVVDGAAAPTSASASTIPRRLLGAVPRALQTSRIILDDVVPA